MQTIRKGSKGYAVEILQQQLAVAVDGIFGSQTEDALKAYQKAKGLDVDGICGRRTWSTFTFADKAIIPTEDIKQFDKPHGAMIYGPDKSYSTYAAGGCGVASFAIVQRSYFNVAEKATETVQRIGQYSWQHGYRIKNGGTNAGLFKTNGTTYTTTRSASAIRQALLDGKLVILCIKKGFANGYQGTGHYIVAYGFDGDKLLLRDVGSSKTSRQYASLSTVATGLKQAYIINKME